MLLKQKKISVCIGMLCGSVLVPSGAWAQIAPPPDYDQKLGDVVVSATISGTQLKNMTQNTTVLTKEELEISPDQTIDQVLKNAPSVFLNDQPYYEKDPTGQGINVRGLGTARTLILIDGVPANDAMYGNVQWNLVPISSIQDVEFIRGGVSNLYGNYGMGGVINITTKPMKDNGNEVSASYGSYGTQNVAASKDIAINDVLKLRFSTDYFHTAGYVQAATIYPARNVGGVASSSVSSTATGSTGVAKGMGPEFANGSNYRLQGSLKFSPDTDGFFKMGYHEMQNLPTGGYVQGVKATQESTFSGGTNTRIGDGKKLATNLFYENTTLIQQNITAATASANPYVSRIDINPYNTLGGSVQYVHDLKDQVIDQFTAGADMRAVEAINNGTVINSSGVATGAKFYAQGKQQFYGASGQVKSKLQSIPLQMTLSARVDQWMSQVPIYYVQSTTGAQTPTNSPNQSKTEFSPNLGLLYELTKNINLRSAAYQGFHAPGLNNMIRSYGTSSYTLANPNLSPETMKGYEAGFDYRWNEGIFQLTGYKANVYNAINPVTVDCPSGYSGCTSATQQSNSQTLHAQGIEAQGRYDFHRQWSAEAGYTLTQSILTSQAASNLATNPINSQLPGTPGKMGNLGLTYYPTVKSSITTTLRYIGPSWWDSLHTVEVPTYFVVGLRANYEISPNVTMFASAVNLLNRNYVTFGGTSAPIIRGQPQTGTIGARITF